MHVIKADPMLRLIIKLLGKLFQHKASVQVLTYSSNHIAEIEKRIDTQHAFNQILTCFHFPAKFHLNKLTSSSLIYF